MADAPKKYRLEVHIEGVVLTMDDFTLDEWSRIEAATGTSWSDVNPLRNARHAVPVLTEALCRAGLDRPDARRRVGKMTATEMLEHVVVEEYADEDDLPDEYHDGVPVIDPKEAPGAPETTGS